MSDIFQGKRVRLRGLQPADAEFFHAWNRDTDMARAVDWIWPPMPLEWERHWLEKQVSERPTGDNYNLGIENAQGELVGTITSHDCDRRTGCFSYGVAIRDEYQRRGYAREAILLLLRWFFEELRYQKVTVDVYSFNEASLRLHDSLGFVREGRIRRTVYTGGRHFDQIIFGMTAEEFAERYPQPPRVVDTEE